MAKKQMEKIAKKKALTRRLAAIDPAISVEGEDLDQLSCFRSAGGYFSAQVSDDSVSLELHGVPAGKAEAIIRLLLGKMPEPFNSTDVPGYQAGGNAP